LYYISLSINIKIKIYRTVSFFVVSYGFTTWSLKLREEHKLRVCQNRALRRIYVPKRDEVTGEWINLNNEEVNYL